MPDEVALQLTEVMMLLGEKDITIFTVRKENQQLQQAVIRLTQENELLREQSNGKLEQPDTK